MIGVVVWSSLERQKAVIWCDDHGALAYLQGPDHLADGSPWPEAGDLLDLDCETIGDLRHARNVTVVSSGHCPGLPQVLRDSASQEPALRLVTSHGRRVDLDHGDEEAQTDRLRRVVACGG